MGETEGERAREGRMLDDAREGEREAKSLLRLATRRSTHICHPSSPA
jgi:hypothetical protein